MTEIILKADVEKIGKAGTIVKVKDGFARNYLIPKGLAVEVSEANLRRLEQEKKLKELEKEKIKQTAQRTAEQISGLSCTVAVEATDDDKLYGDITPAEIAQAIEAEKNIKIDKKLIVIKEPIRSLGIYEVEVKFHPEVISKVRLWVTRK
jgi:large subunit ribosomal protein L9